MQARSKRAAAPSPQPVEEQDDDYWTPEQMDAFRFDLARRLRVIIGNRLKRWRSCREPCCKRKRQCCLPRGLCSNPKQSQRLFKPEQAARARAKMFGMLRELLKEDDAEYDVPSNRRSVPSKNVN